MGYITVAEVRAEGVPIPPAGPSDAQVQAAINLWSQTIDKLTRQWFESRSLTLQMDGNGSDILFLPVPIIDITALYTNDDFTTAVTTDRYEVYKSRAIPDDRPNPRVKLKRSTDTDDIFSGVIYPEGYFFVKGQRNQKLVGTFGYLEPDGTTPLLIKRAVMKLISMSLTTMYGSWPALPPLVGPVKSETTDGHSISYGISDADSKSNLAIVKDPEIAMIIRHYRAPLAMAVPTSYDWA